MGAIRLDENTSAVFTASSTALNRFKKNNLNHQRLSDMHALIDPSQGGTLWDYC